MHSGFFSFPALALATCVAWVLLFRRQIPHVKEIGEAVDDGVMATISRVGPERGCVTALSALIGLFFESLHRIGPGPESHTANSRLESLSIDALSVVALYVLYRCLCSAGRARLVRLALVTAFVILYGSALVTTDIRSADLYAYVAYAKLGLASYAPTDTPFTGAFAVLNPAIAAAWRHLEPAPYGPLFLGLDRLIAGGASSFEQARLFLRLLNVAAVLASLFALRGLGFGLPVVAIVGLDPEIVLSYVVDGHNDIVAIAILLGAMAAYPRNRIAGIVLAVGAGAIKAPYIVPALLLSVRHDPFGRRAWSVAAIFFGTIAVSSIGGLAYIHAVAWHGALYASGQTVVQRILHACAAGAAIASVAVAVWFRRTLWPASLLFPELFAAGFPWYPISGLPYALTHRKGLAALLILFPLVTYAFRVTNSFG